MIANCVDAGLRYGMYQHRGEALQFMEWLTARGPIGCVIEIGAHRGGSAVMFLEAGAERVISVDLPEGPWGGIGTPSANARDAELTGRFGERYIPVRGDSADLVTVSLATTALNGKLADVLFIDGDHSYAGVRRDFELYSLLVRDGAVVAFHDILDTQYHRDRGVTVSRFWNELAGGVEFSVPGSEWGGIGALVVRRCA